VNHAGGELLDFGIDGLAGGQTAEVDFGEVAFGGFFDEIRIA
jgi:hypothetical protein